MAAPTKDTASAQTSEPTISWIWQNSTPADNQKAYFRREFTLPRDIISASLTVTCDNWQRVWINGKDLGWTSEWGAPANHDVIKHIVQGGRNVIAVPPADPETTRWFAMHVQPHEAALRAWLARSLGPRVMVDDVIQEAYIRLLHARAGGELQAPKAFLFAVARNIGLDQLRRHAVSRTDSLVETDITNVLDDGESIPYHIARDQELAVLT